MGFSAKFEVDRISSSGVVYATVDTASILFPFSLVGELNGFQEEQDASMKVQPYDRFCREFDAKILHNEDSAIVVSRHTESLDYSIKCGVSADEMDRFIMLCCENLKNPEVNMSVFARHEANCERIQLDSEDERSIRLLFLNPSFFLNRVKDD